MVDASEINLYSIKPPHVRALWAWSVDGARAEPSHVRVLWAWSVDGVQAALIHGVKYSTEKGGVDEIRTRNLFVTLTLDTMSKDQFNQKLKLMVEAPGIDLYSITYIVHRGLSEWVNSALSWALNTDTCPRGVRTHNFLH